MPLTPNILKRITQLGATHGDARLDLEPALRAIKFDHPLFELDNVNDSLSMEDSRAWLAGDDARFFDTIPRGPSRFHFRTFDDHYFKPFTPGSPDNGGWGDLDEAYFRKQVSGTILEFIEIGFMDGGFPDLFYVCLDDPDPTNPQVYATDHEESWQKIWQQGDLLTFLNRFASEAELRATLKHMAEN